MWLNCREPLLYRQLAARYFRRQLLTDQALHQHLPHCCCCLVAHSSINHPLLSHLVMEMEMARERRRVVQQLWAGARLACLGA